MSLAPDTPALTPADLLIFLAQRGGQEYAVQLVLPSASARPGKKRLPIVEPAAQPLYRLTLRGEEVQATGPSGQTRQLSRQAFLDVFGAYRFAGPQATGLLTDLGPLFGVG